MAYEGEAASLGREFLDAVGVALGRIEDDPHRFSVVHGKKHRALLKRFPYGLYFRVETTSVSWRVVFTGTEAQGRGSLGADA
jgi:hypothetical protein